MPSGWGEDADRTVSPVSASQITTLHDWVDESIPATSVTSEKLLPLQVDDATGVTAYLIPCSQTPKTADQRHC